MAFNAKQQIPVLAQSKELQEKCCLLNMLEQLEPLSPKGLTQKAPRDLTREIFICGKVVELQLEGDMAKGVVGFEDLRT